MVKGRTRVSYVCQQCGWQSAKWLGRCSECGQWNTLGEVVEAKPPKHSRSTAAASEPMPLGEVPTNGFERLALSGVEFNRVLGGGIVPGSVVLVGGDPGIGKSTLLLQVGAEVAARFGTVLYVSGEESPQQVKLRADRLEINSNQLLVHAETCVERVLDAVERLRPALVVIDSIQTMYLEAVSSAAGGITQVRECAAALLRAAKDNGIPVFLVGHVTKEGEIAGPRVLEHIVDAVLYMEGERFNSFRLLRAAKNRFGSTDEVGVFEMQSEGLREVSNPSELFLSERGSPGPGSTVIVSIEGTRPILVEVQALTAQTSFGMPRRIVNGFDFNRLLLLTAVLSKRVGLGLGNQDVYVNIVGGMRVSEPAADLGVALAIASNFRDRAVPPDMAAFGEVGLSGELRRVGQADRRLAEAAKLGFARCLVPASTKDDVTFRRTDLEVVPVRSLREAVQVALAG